MPGMPGMDELRRIRHLGVCRRRQRREARRSRDGGSGRGRAEGGDRPSQGRSNVVRGQATRDPREGARRRDSVGEAGRKTRRSQLAKEAADVERTLNAPVRSAGSDQAGVRAVRRDAAGRRDERRRRCRHSSRRCCGRRSGRPRCWVWRAPRRPPGDTAMARTRYQELAAMPGAAPGSPAVVEAQRALKATND